MRQKNRVLLRGLAVVASFLCALCLGAESIAASGDYKGMVDSMLGGASAGGSSSEAYVYESEYENLTQMLTERKRIAEQFGEEGCVLLKNDGALPLRSSQELENNAEKRVTVLGNRPYTYDDAGTLRDTRLTFYGGITGSKIYEQSVTTNEGTIRLPVTLEAALESENVRINPAMKSFYSDKPYSPLPAGSESADQAGGAYSIDEPAVALGDTGGYQAYDDAAIVVIGRSSGEGRDYLPGKSGVKSGSTQKSALGLSDEERNLIAVADQIAPGKVIVLINSAVTMEIDELKNDDRVNSVLWIGLPGPYGLNGVARVLGGKVSPSGSLSDTYAVEASAAPAAQNFGAGNPDGTAQFTWSNGSYTLASNGHYVVMAEGIYTGYYYYETRYADTVLNPDSGASGAKGAVSGASEWKYEDEVSYTFGYGMSYTTFSQRILPETFVYNEAEKTVSVDVEVVNTGTYAGKSTVQLYVQSPYTDYDKKNGVEKSAVQLVAFEKTDVLQPQEPTTLTLTADIKYFASYDETASHDGVTGGYIMENGAYCFAIGNGAHEALNNILVNCHSVPAENLYAEEGSSINAAGTYVWNTGEASGFSFDSDGVDTSYFAQSEAGQTVYNQMQDADYNYFETGREVVYLSRNDWQGTYPVSYTGLPVSQEMDKYLRQNASVYEFGTAGSSPEYVQFGVDHAEEYDENTGVPLENTDIASYKGKAYDAEDWDYLLQQITFDEAWQFAPLGGTNCKAFTSVNAPVVWQIDGPNGNVTRSYSVLAPTTGTMAVQKSDPNANYMSADMPCEPMIAATFNRELLHEEGKIFGEDNLWSRNPIMWAPGMNLHRSPFNSRNHEYYSEDPVLTNLLGTSFVRGGLEKGSILSAKHFAFNTQESYREGLCQFFNEQTGREMELRAFQGLCEDVEYVNSSGNRLDALGLMSSFSRVGVCGVNAHTGMMKNILRGEWGFKGLISTDMVSRVGFFNPQDCVINNVTFMATSSGESFLQSAEWATYNNKQLVRNDPNMMTALYENMHYYTYAIANSSALNGYAPGDVLGDSMSWWQYTLIGIGAGLGGIALVVVGFVLFAEIREYRKNLARGGMDNERKN